MSRRIASRRHSGEQVHDLAVGGTVGSDRDNELRNLVASNAALLNGEYFRHPKWAGSADVEGSVSGCGHGLCSPCKIVTTHYNTGTTCGGNGVRDVKAPLVRATLTSAGRGCATLTVKRGVSQVSASKSLVLALALVPVTLP